MFVNEYGPTYAVNVPGWMVGDFVSLETAGADQGMLTCANSAGCYNLLDGLIGADGTPQMPYWVMQAYSQMAGSRVPVPNSPSNVYTLATRDDTSQTMEALIGRADDCFGGTECPQFHTVSAGPVNVALSLSIPWAAQAVNVVIHPLPDQARRWPLRSASTTYRPRPPRAGWISNVRVHGGAVQVTIPSGARWRCLLCDRDPGRPDYGPGRRRVRDGNPRTGHLRVGLHHPVGHLGGPVGVGPSRRL